MSQEIINGWDDGDCHRSHDPECCRMERSCERCGGKVHYSCGWGFACLICEDCGEDQTFAFIFDGVMP